MRYTKRGNLPNSSKNYVVDVLKARGIEDPDRYIHPSERDLLDPYLLDNVEKGVDLLAMNIQQGAKIFLQVDSDADGYTSAAIFYNYVKKISPETEIEYRVHKGKQHGIIVETVPEDCQLVVIIDAGSNQGDEIEELYELGHEVLIIDHHHFETPLRRGVLINNQVGGYPNKGLSGAGVLFKFLQVYDEKYLPDEGHANDQLDLVALSLISDMMNLSHYENRYLVNIGLGNVKNHGFAALVEKQAYSIGDTVNLTPEKIAFYITPLINAIVRVGTEQEKETMFLAFVDGTRQLPSAKRGAKPGDIETAAQQTARVATNARNRQNKLKEQAIALMQTKVKKYGLDEHKIILITLDERESAIVDSTLTGLIAMQLTKYYMRPVIVTRVNDDGDLFQGSLRGINDSGLADFREFCETSGLVEYAQGHANASGLGILRDNREDFLAYADEHLKDIDFGETFYEIDYEFTEADNIELAIFQLGSSTQMWGQGVTAPMIVIKEAQVFSQDIHVMGKNKEHFKFNWGGVDCVKFFAKELIAEIEGMSSFTITILGRASVNNWQGRITPQFMIEDYEIIDNSTSF